MTKKTIKPLILVDGSSYLYRAFHALPSLSNSKGFPTGAIYGVVNMLQKLLSDHDPEYIAVVFDAKGKTFRDDLYDKYKANRSQMPSDLTIQIEPIHAAITALGLPIIMVDGVEADDVIGTIAKDLSKQNKPVLVSTSDKDLAQLVDDNITLVNTMTGNILDKASVITKFGISAEQIIDYLALIGDTIDNIPGVPLVGPKTAVKWLKEYGSLDNIIAQANSIKGKVGENLRASIPHLPLSRQLATIKLDVPLTLDLSDLKRQEPDKSMLIELYTELEFKNWLAALLEENSATISAEKHANYSIIKSENELTEWINKIEAAGQFAFSLITQNHDYLSTNIVGIGLATESGIATYLPLLHDDNQSFTQFNLNEILPLLTKIFSNKAIAKITHNVKYTSQVLTTAGIELEGPLYDAMIESYILDSASNNHDINSLTLKYLAWRTTPVEDVIGKGSKQISFNQQSLEKVAIYAAELADAILQIHAILSKKILDDANLKHIFEEIELQLIPVLAAMEKSGVLIDSKKLEKQTTELELRLKEIEKQAYQLAGDSFNMNSPKQLQEILFTKLALPVLQKTPKGQASTADAVLQELALEFELPKLIIEYRSLSKLITTYTRSLPQQIHPKTFRVHTSYNQTVTTTGRLSSSDPNLQNIPIRTEEGRKIRQAFIAPPGHKIISADYSQIELRIMSHISNDPGLLTAFENNLDIHQATAAEVLQIPLDKVSSDQRRSAKVINFGLMYGMSAFGLAKQLGIERSAAQEYIDRYFTRYPQVKAYMENTRKQAHERGFVETLAGRRLYLPEINSSQIMRQKAAERAAINAPLQGTAADIIKNAMITINHWLHDQHIDAKMIMQVHDELVFEVADTQIEKVVNEIRELMMNAAKLKVPLIVSIGVGDNWDAASSH